MSKHIKNQIAARVQKELDAAKMKAAAPPKKEPAVSPKPLPRPSNTSPKPSPRPSASTPTKATKPPVQAKTNPMLKKLEGGLKKKAFKLA